MSFDETAGRLAPRDIFSREHDERRRKSPRYGAWRVVALLPFVGALAATALIRHPEQNNAQATPTTFSRIGLVADERLAPLLSFRQVEGARVKIRYEARIRPESAERWDTLTSGDISGEDALFQVTLHLAKPTIAKPALFVALARQSAELDAAILHAASVQSSATERGSIEAAEVTLAGPKGERRCLGFRLAGSSQIDVFGLACGARGAPLDLAALGRLIDRLAPTDSGQQAGVADVLKNIAT